MFLKKRCMALKKHFMFLKKRFMFLKVLVYSIEALENSLNVLSLVSYHPDEDGQVLVYFTDMRSCLPLKVCYGLL